jgi:hypothetical protein
MRNAYSILFCILIASCSEQKTNTTQLLQNRIDSLQIKLADSYKPGFGDFMIGIQIHHSKLWFAGKNRNWELADFEAKEILETVDDLAKYQKERKEMMMMGMLTRAIDSVRVAIGQKNTIKFNSSFSYLTKTCNVCHSASKFEFNVIKIPETSPFTNQEFQLNK